MKTLKLFTITFSIFLIGIIYSGCNQNQSTEPSAQMTDDEYLKFSCKNKGKCCSIMHIQKFKYVSTQKSIEKKRIKSKKKELKVKNNTSFTLNFD